VLFVVEKEAVVRQVLEDMVDCVSVVSDALTTVSPRGEFVLKTFMLAKAIVPTLVQSFLTKKINIGLAMFLLGHFLKIF
jgi:hypothetical protein